jgi:FkbM family methyltransferase
MFVSYAQNFEDVMLWRAFFDIEKGFYIDVGAQHPEIDSVSKAFYLRGWRGIHVEPIPEYAALLRQDRPDEQVFQAALGISSGLETIYAISNTGLSTGQSTVAERHKLESGFESMPLVVPRITLDDVFRSSQQTEIHWLKIDVEGSERAVLEGWKAASFRPWVIVVEATLPGSQIENHDLWEPLIVKRGYSCVYRDGLNRFYLADEHSTLKERFAYPPNVFDDASLAGIASAPWARLIISNYEQRLKSERTDFERRTFEAEQTHASVTADLCSKLNQRDSEITSLIQGLAMREADLREQISGLSARAIDLDKQLLAAQSAQQHLHDTLTSRQQVWEQREALLVQENQLTQYRLQVVYYSRSWRVTAPLRAFARLIRRILGKGGAGGERSLIHRSLSGSMQNPYASGSTIKSHGSDLRTAQNQSSESVAGEKELPPHAQRIYKQLKMAIAQKKKGQS